MRAGWYAPEAFAEGRLVPRRTGPKPGHARRDVLGDAGHALVCAMRDAGLSLRAIATAVGISPVGVLKALRRSP